MPFPQVERVVFKKNPLDKVICQARFPSLLKIESELPSAFQELIRSTYPYYSRKVEYRQEVPFNMGAVGSADQGQKLPRPLVSFGSQPSSNHEFVSEDKNWVVNLTKTFIALSTVSYTRWEDFRTKFSELLFAINEVYAIPFYTRIGLRYVDVFHRSKLGLNDTRWKDLLSPFILGLISSDIESEITNHVSTTEVKLDDDESMTRITASFGEHIESKEQVFILDSDFFCDKKSSSEKVFPKLDFLNARATNLIQWVMTKKLFDALEPTKL